MSGHVFLWRIGSATVLYYAQPLLGLAPLLGGAMLFLPGLLRLGVVWLVALPVWACLMTGKLLWIRPGRVTVIPVFWGMPYWRTRLSGGCRVRTGGGFDHDEVVLEDGEEAVCIETPLDAEVVLAQELRRALARAAMVPISSGPRAVGGSMRG